MSPDANWLGGQRLVWKLVDGTGSGSAVVVATWSDAQMGLSPEGEQYAARWMKARRTGDAAVETELEEETMTFLLGTDEQIYLDGKEVLIKAV